MEHEYGYASQLKASCSIADESNVNRRRSPQRDDHERRAEDAVWAAETNRTSACAWS